MTVPRIPLLAKRLLILTVCFLLVGLLLFGFDFSSGYVLSAYTGQYVLHENSFAAARIVTPASESTNGETEVMFANGVKAWIRHTIPSHRAQPGELEMGDVILWNEYHSSYHTEENYRAGAWHLGLVTSTDQVAMGAVGINNFLVNIDWVRVPDKPIEFVIDLREGESLAAFQKGSSIYDSGYGVAETKMDPRPDHRGGRVTFSNGVQAEAPYIIESHRAGRDEIEIGDKVLWNDNFPNQWTENNYRLGGWYFGVVTGVDELFKDVVEVNSVPVPLVWIRIEGEAPYQASTGTVAGRRTALAKPEVQEQRHEDQEVIGPMFSSVTGQNEMTALAGRINSAVTDLDRIIVDSGVTDSLVDPRVAQKLESIYTDSQELESILREVLQRTIRVENYNRINTQSTIHPSVSLQDFMIQPEVGELIGQSRSLMAAIHGRAGGTQHESSDSENLDPCGIDYSNCDEAPCISCCSERYPFIDEEAGQTGNSSDQIESIDHQNERNKNRHMICLASCGLAKAQCLFNMATDIEQDAQSRNFQNVTNMQ